MGMILAELVPGLLPEHQCEFLAHFAILARAFERNKLAALAASRFLQMGKVQHVQRQNLARWTAIMSKKHPLDWQHRSPVDSLALEKKIHFYIQ
jgi:hypothetical protein